MKRFSRLTSLAISLVMLAGIMTGVTAANKNIKSPFDLQEYTQMYK